MCVQMFTRCLHIVYTLLTHITEYCPVNGVQNIFHVDEMIFMFPEKSK